MLSTSVATVVLPVKWAKLETLYLKIICRRFNLLQKVNKTQIFK